MFSLRIPVATYRLQFSKQFRFQNAQVLVPYLHRLGISDLYASPILRARPGSSHGYDVTDPSCLNPELGTDEEFETLVGKVKSHEMGMLLDIVPNHMAASPDNPWWMDLLESGLCSPYVVFFDIDWGSPDSALKNKVLLPILDNLYDEALERQALALTLGDAGLLVCYHGYRLPLDVKSYSLVLSHRLSALEIALGVDHPIFRQLKKLITAMKHLLPCTDVAPGKAGEQCRERQAIKEEFWHIVNTSPEVKVFLLENIALFNGREGEPDSFKLLDEILTRQAYRLVFWKTVCEQINYRRFFDISDLVGIRVEELQVFEATHALLFRLVREGKVTGLRVDHIDGLRDPLQYLSRLQHYLGPETEGKPPGFYIVVEKILADGESLPEEWPLFGTTGYDFLNMVNALFVDSKGIEAMDETYSRLTGSKIEFADVVYGKKKQVMEELFRGEMNELGHVLAHLARQGCCAHALSSEELRRVLSEVTACLPVYRTYTRTFDVSLRDRLYLECAIREAWRRNPAVGVVALDFLKRVLLLNFPDSLTSEQKEAWFRFVLQWQQMTGAIMAKGQEDTALYTCNRLVSLNEVGGSPGSAGLSVDEFHHRNLSRLEHWSGTLNATSTHDTKRSEDVRARINVLSEVPEAWERHLAEWSLYNQAKKQAVSGQPVPEPNTEVLLYQTLVGAWPLSQREVPEFKERLKRYMVKAVREAKIFTSWLRPNLQYENALLSFIESILEIPSQNEFLRDLLEFQRQVAYYGWLNSLAQVLLKITSPGVPDFYQGTELWDFSLVDPDNRRPVDFEIRIKLLASLIQKEAQGQLSLVREVLTSWEDGRIKLYLIYKSLNLRRAQCDLFRRGHYIPLQVSGRRREHVCSFVRRWGNMWVLAAVPRLFAKLVPPGMPPLGRKVWEDDLLLLPEDAPQHWTNVFTGETLKISQATKGMPLCCVFGMFPVALLVGTRGLA